MLDEVVGPADPYDRGVDARVVQVLDDRAAEAVVQDVILEGADDPRSSRPSAPDGLAVERA